MAKKIQSPRQALCVFAKNVKQVSLFYQQALGLKVRDSDKTHDLLVGPNGNRPLEPRALEVEFFPMEEVLHEKVKIH